MSSGITGRRDHLSADGLHNRIERYQGLADHSVMHVPPRARRRSARNRYGA
jgi:hypothetical protein